MVAEYDEVVKERICYGPQNARYTSPEIQNLLLTITGGMVQEKNV